MKKMVYIIIPIITIGFFTVLFYRDSEIERDTKIWLGQSQDGLWRVEYKNNQRLGSRDPEDTCSGFLYYEGSNKDNLENVSYEFRNNGIVVCYSNDIDLVFPYEFVTGGRKPKKEDNLVLYLRWYENGEEHQTEIKIDTQNFKIERINL